MSDITDRKQAELLREKHLHDMTERVKELECIYSVSELVQTRTSMEKLFQDVAELIPSGWQYPEITVGKIVFDGLEYVSRPFEETQWKQSADILIGGEAQGSIEVYYLQQMPQAEEGPFLLEERNLIDGLARMISRAIEHDQVEKDREHARAFLQTVIDGFPESMMVIDLDHTIVLANKSVFDLAGQDPVQACLKCHQVSHNSDSPCDDANHPCPLEMVLETRDVVTLEHIHYDAEENPHSIEIVAAPIFDDSGEIIQIIESCRDISARKKAEADRLHLERQVLQAQKLESLGVLAGGIAHDFNNLLTVILGNAELALHNMSPHAPAIGNLRAIEKTSQRAAELSKQMLAYSGKGRFIIEPIDLREFIEEMTHLLEVSISKKAVLKFNFADNLPVFDGDTTQIRQIIMNMITNASEAIGDKSGVIAISTGAMDCDRAYLDTVNDALTAGLNEPLPEGLYVYLEVADTGCGMNGETLDKIFDPFFTTKFTGRGLGLAAVLGIVLGHNGAIKVYSEPGKGTTFKILFPVSESANITTASRNLEVAEFDHWPKSYTVMIVDDEQTVCAVGKLMVNALGLEAVCASDGVEAVELFKASPDEIDCILLDLTMPHMDGEQAFRELRSIRSDVAVILCSGYNEQDATQRFAGKGLAGFLQKPYSLAALKNKLVETLPTEQ